MWYSKQNEYSQGKLRHYTDLKVRPGFEQYLNLSNPNKICAHKFPIEIGRFENNAPAERVCPYAGKA